MIDRTVATVIDAERCTGCGPCVVETCLRAAGRKGYLQRTFAAPLSSGEGSRG